MDPNQFQFQEQFENVTKKKNASFFRMRAREFLNENYWMAFGVYFVAMMLGGTSSGGNVSISLGENLYLWEIILMLAFSLLGTLAISFFLASPIRTGYARYNLGLADGRKPGFEDLFYCFRSGQYMRTVKLGALYTLVVAVSAIPTIVFGVLGIMFLTASNIGATLFGISSETLLTFGYLVCFALTAVAFIFLIVVEYRYYFAFHILADCPDITPRDALRNSATLMKGRKWKLFCLNLSFIGWMMLGALACGVGMLFVYPYIAAADVAFYDDASQRSKVDDTEFPSLDPEDYDPNLAEW